MGISRKKSGINRLTEAFQESQQAMRYLMADTRKKLFFIRISRSYFHEKSSQIQEILTEFLCKLNGGEDKTQIIRWLEQVLTAMESTEKDECSGISDGMYSFSD